MPERIIKPGPVPPLLHGIHEVPDPRFKKGDRVRVKGMRGYFHFIGRFANDQGDEWIDVYGGNGNNITPARRQTRKLRSFPADRIIEDKRPVYLPRPKKEDK